MSQQPNVRTAAVGLRRRRRASLLISAAAAAMAVASPALSQIAPPPGTLPSGGAPVGDSAIIGTPSGNALTITAQNRALIDWTSFDIAADSSVTFIQPGATSVVLNRVTGGGASDIHGQLSANGVVGILNPNGVYFDGAATVNVGGLIATTGNIADQAAFLAGGALSFTGATGGAVAVGADATVTISNAGLAAFVAPHVTNNGEITAVAGRVVLAAGATFTLDLAGDGLLALGVSSSAPIVQNHGDIFAEGGTIRLSAAAAASVVGNIINTGGLEVRTADISPDGAVILEGGRTTVHLAGDHDADFRITNRLGLSGGVTLDGGGAAIIEGRVAIIGHAPAGSVIDGVTIEGLAINAKAGDVALIAESNSADAVYNTTNLTVRNVTVTMNGQHAIGLFDVNGATFQNVIIHGDGSAFHGIEAIGLRNFTMTGGRIENTRTGMNVWTLAGYETNGGLNFSSVDFTGNRTHLSLGGAGANLNALLAANSFDRTVHATGGFAIHGDLVFAISDSAAGSTLNLGAGVFEGGVTLNKSGMSLVGAGAGATTVTTSATGRGFTIAANNVSISDLAINGPLSVPHYLKLDWDTGATAVDRMSGNYGIYIDANRTGFRIANTVITDVRTGIGVSANALGTITGNFIENTKGAMLLQSSGAGVNISGNTAGLHGNEWGVVLNLASIIANGDTTSQASLARQGEILAFSLANNGMSILDRAYARANRTHVFVDAVSTAAATDDFSKGNGLGNRRQAIRAIGDGLNAVVAGGIVTMRNGVHALPSQLNIARPVTLRGESAAGTVINAAASGYGMFVTADDVALLNFTFQANDTASSSNGRYGVKVQPVANNPANRLRRFTIENVTIAGFGGSELDLNGVAGATIRSVTLDGRGTKGAGLAITDSANVTVQTITTRDNLWGAVALYQSNRWFDQRLDNITIAAAGSSFGEPLGLFVQQESSLHAQHGQLNLTGFAYAVRNPNHRNGQTGFGGALMHANDGLGGQFTFFRTSLSDATNFALNLNTAQARASSIENWTGTSYGNVFTVVNGLSIASALRDARGGATVNVGAGTYSDPVTLDKSLTLNGAGMTSTMLTGGLTITGTIGGLTVKNLSVSGDGGGNTVIRNAGAITGFTLDRVRIDGLDAAGRHGIAGGTIGGAISITNSEFLNIDGWAAFDTRSGADTNQGSQITSAKFSGNLLDNVQGHIAFRQDSSGAFPDVEISGNVVRNTGSATNSFGAVFKAFNARVVSVTGNTVSGVGTSGFNPSGEAAYGAVLMVRGASTLTVANNSFTGNRMVFAVEPGRALPGVTNFTNNSFVNNAYVLYTPASVTGGGTVNFGAGNTIVSGANTVQHVVWRSAGALDMTQVRFDGLLGSAMTLNQQFALERQITHGVDVAGAGLVRLAAGRVFVTPSTGALARGVALASSGDIIHVADGAYSESVTTTRANLSLAFGAATVNSLTMTGAGTRLSGHVTASGGLTFAELILPGALTLISDGGDITAGAVSGPYALSALARAGNVRLGALDTATAQISGRTVTTAGARTSGAQIYMGTDVRLAGTYATGGGAFTVAGPATLTGATSISSGGGNITLGAADGAAAGAQAFGINAGSGRITIGALGAATRLGDTAITGADITLAGGSYAANSLAFAGGPVRLTAQTTTLDTRQSASAAGNITVAGDLLGVTSGGQNIVFIAGTGTSASDGDITIGNAGSDTVRLGAMSVTGGDFSAKTVKLAGDFTSVLSGDQTFSAQTLDTLGGVSNRIAGSVSGPIVSGGAITIDAGGSMSSPIIANGGVAISAGGSTSGAIQSSGAVTIIAGGEMSNPITANGGVNVSAGGSMTGPISSGGAVTITAGGGTSGQINAGGGVAITARGPVSNRINAASGVNIDASGPIVANVTTTSGVVSLKSTQRVEAEVTGGQVRVNAPGGTVRGNFASIETGQNGAFVVNEQPVIGGGVDARRVMTDEFSIPADNVTRARRTVQNVQTLVGASGANRRATVRVDQVDNLGDMLAQGYDAIVVQISGSGPALEEESTSEGADSEAPRDTFTN